ncbi:MAG: hypothetical protein HY074_16690 [Deltaproteobacteria bacterium]|nr:hypothetical protein [Deltaproteobacteria bacterium]
MKLVLLLLALITLAPTASAAISTEAAYDKVAHHLELVRNQIELTIENHAGLAKDVGRQEREFAGMRVYQLIPLARDDSKNSRALLAALRAGFAQAAAKHTGFRLSKARFTSQWKATRMRIPAELPFDTDFRLKEEQVVDYRLLELTLDFDTAAPRNPASWLREQQPLLQRLVEPVSWTRVGKRLLGRARIFRYRDLEYPKMLAPDLAQYSTPLAAAAPSAVEQATLKRITRYRQQIITLWPLCQPYLDDLRAFARNDARMNFFLNHASVQ